MFWLSALHTRALGGSHSGCPEAPETSGHLVGHREEWPTWLEPRGSLGAMKGRSECGGGAIWWRAQQAEEVGS